MSDTSEDYEKSNKGIHLSKDGIDCFPCRCNRKIFHKETKTTTDNEGKTIVNKTEDRSSWRVGSGRHATPEGNKIFETNMDDEEDVDTVDTGYGSRKSTPEERLDRLEEDVERIDKDLDTLKKNNFNSLD